MLKYLINAISRGLSFSKTESRGTLVLIFIISIALVASRARISYLRNQPAIPADTITNEWLEMVASSIEKKESAERLNDYDTHFSRSSYDEKAKGTPTKIASVAPPKVIIKEPIKDLNFATAEELQVVKGIGPSFSKRIIKYRDLLGGYVDSIQLHEVYGLNDETIHNLFKKFSIQSDAKPINFNTDSIKLLARHPYISYDIARVIIKYRKQHGDITSVDHLKKIKAIDDSTFLRLKPYLE